MSSTSSSATPTPTITLSNGVKIPTIGYGCSFANFSITDGSQPIGFTPERSYVGISSALRAGFRHFDAACFYQSERHLGLCLAHYFMEGTLKRDDVFLTSKYAHPDNGFYAPDHTTCLPTTPNIRSKILSQFDKTCDDMGVGYLDLVLMHWPGAFDNHDEKLARAHRLAVWSIFEELYNHKKIRAIGVANFSQKHLEQLIQDGCKIVPMVNQIEIHPYCQQTALAEYCRSRGIVVEAYSPLGAGNASTNLFIDPTLISIAKSLNRTVSQVVLRWIVQQGYVALPRSSSAHHNQQNLDVFHFELSSQEMEQIKKLDVNKHTCPDPATIV